MGWKVRIGVWLVAGVAAAGCHAPPTAPTPTPIVPSPPELPLVSPASLEPDFKNLPSVDPLTTTADDVTPPPTGYRGMSEEACARESAARASAAGLLNQENRIPLRPEGWRSNCAADALTREVRSHLAAEGRNRAAAEALDEYFQLADAEGRAEVMRATLPVLDQLRETVRKARREGVRVPVDPDELDRQRASLLGLLSQADAGVQTLDIDLKRRMGVPARTAERLRPVGDFSVMGNPPDVEAAVRTAVESRPDLLALRAVYVQLSPETLPIVRELLRGQMGSGSGLIAGGPIRGALLLTWVLHLNAAATAELEIRRQQLYSLIAERERQAADEVRAAAVALTAQTTQVALARWKAEQLAAKAAEAKPQGPLQELAADLEQRRARADVIAAVMAWHRARVKLLAAQGLLAGSDPTLCPR